MLDRTRTQPRKFAGILAPRLDRAARRPRPAEHAPTPRRRAGRHRRPTPTTPPTRPTALRRDSSGGPGHRGSRPNPQPQCRAPPWLPLVAEPLPERRGRRPCRSTASRRQRLATPGRIGSEPCRRMDADETSADPRRGRGSVGYRRGEPRPVPAARGDATSADELVRELAGVAAGAATDEAAFTHVTAACAARLAAARSCPSSCRSSRRRRRHSVARRPGLVVLPAGRRPASRRRCMRQPARRPRPRRSCCAPRATSACSTWSILVDVGSAGRATSTLSRAALDHAPSRTARRPTPAAGRWHRPTRGPSPPCETLLRLFHELIERRGASRRHELFDDARARSWRAATCCVVGTRSIHEYDGAVRTDATDQHDPDLRRERRLAGTPYVRRGLHVADDLLEPPAGHAARARPGARASATAPSRLRSLAAAGSRSRCTPRTGRGGCMNRWRRLT